MNNAFFAQPILNSPYAYPHRHWELDGAGQPTQRIPETRRRAEFITPIPKPPCVSPMRAAPPTAGGGADRPLR